MKQTTNSFWENEIYSQGQHLNKYPYDNVVSFIFRNYPRDKPKNEVAILEIGSGAGNNLWFAAKEGFNVVGIDGSQSAIEFAKKRFETESLKAEFWVGDFTDLPFKDNNFDLVIDRASLTCCGWEDIKKAVGEVHRVLVKSGKFFTNVYSVSHSSADSGIKNNDGTRSSMKMGSLAGIEHIYFFKEDEFDDLFGKGWKILSKKHKVIHDLENKSIGIHAEWEIIAEKV
ncbi:MAG: class I SAM-dependent methyltransferase [Thermonemataceae bacterium]|nr:class I SAM-dependent methyltransferase [Thermonemataceae bacterium]